MDGVESLSIARERRPFRMPPPVVLDGQPDLDYREIHASDHRPVEADDLVLWLHINTTQNKQDTHRRFRP